MSAERNVDLLTIKDSQFRFAVQPGRLRFAAGMIGRPVEATLSGPNGKQMMVRIVITDCHQRISLTSGQADSGADVAATSVAGRTKGCSLEGDWWIRAMPMFGAHERSRVHEGHINRTSETFSFTSNFEGTRHIFVLGRDKNAIKTFVHNVVIGGKNDAGLIDLGNVCPK